MIYKFEQESPTPNKVIKVARKFTHFYVRDSRSGIKVRFPGGYFIEFYTGSTYVSPVPLDGLEFVSNGDPIGDSERVEFYLSDGPLSFGQTSLDTSGQVISPGSDRVAVSSLPSVRFAANQTVQSERKKPSSMVAETYYMFTGSKRTGETDNVFVERKRREFNLEHADFDSYVHIRPLTTDIARGNNGLSLGRMVADYGYINYALHSEVHSNDITESPHLAVAMSDTAFGTGETIYPGNEIAVRENSTIRIDKWPLYMYLDFPVNRNNELAQANSLGFVNLVRYTY